MKAGTVLLALALLFSTTQCMIKCSIALCSSTPPCHEHQGPASHTPAMCAPSSTAADARTLSAVWNADFGVAPLLPLRVSATEYEPRKPLEAPSPPGIAALSTVVLRI
jgi:hypothetical protein